MSSATPTPFQLPVQAVEWTRHAPTTIKDAEGAVIAECGGQGRHPEEAVAIAAEIVRRLNAHDQLVQVAQHFVRCHDQLTPADIQRAQAVIAEATS